MNSKRQFCVGCVATVEASFHGTQEIEARGRRVDLNFIWTKESEGLVAGVLKSV